ncbi:MAG: UDP-N-acetylmuramoyl-tripeptide--D-alanyl-D-alanine ligase [candidate division Zixibacteria bacterium]|nr:UDP-N-acetylmuramoyl-tripeptide--D-alanyl-D-alanine ligase [candidate division Zixibacteria bacterium]MBU1469436.1 UDP-N-acetylmuramoyl-tripeptide--D-alanyl-D-alanine ligase [candidate division Zixibacteria bacterium]MBU2624190.1 UDP-N-acetylmuramoyl-tripeptide--D-alanyl-D-alanine ligase [candidate division Zixibacteria bacterium]
MIRAEFDTIARIISAVRSEGRLSGVSFTGVSIDSRTIREGNLFVAVAGKSEDGHRFIPDAIKRGAAGIIAKADYEYDPGEKGVVFFAVEDTLEALLKLAAWWLSRFELKKIAVTGTNGKTTTKEMIAAILSRLHSVYRSPGNFNNLFGIPLSIFEMEGSYDFAVFEFGMSTTGEIARLTRIVQPQYGLITNIDAAHLETMLSVDAIAAAKFELFDNMPSDGTVFINLDNDYLRRRFDTERHEKYGFGVHSRTGFSPDRFEINGSGCARFELESIGEVHLAMPGLHSLYNAIGAAAVAHYLKIPGREIKAALESFRSVEMRMETFTVAGVLIINDSYNANPNSMKYALDTLESINARGRKFAVLGDMFELGVTESELHRQVGAHAAKSGPDFLITCGDRARDISAAAVEMGYPSDATKHFANVNDVTEHLLARLHSGDAVLIKASRGMAFDRITTGLQSQLGRSN